MLPFCSGVSIFIATAAVAGGVSGPAGGVSGLRREPGVREEGVDGLDWRSDGLGLGLGVLGRALT